MTAKTNWDQLPPEIDSAIRRGVTLGLTAKAIADDLRATYRIEVSHNQVSGRIGRLRDRGDLEAAPDVTPEAKFNLAVITERERTATRALAREMTAAVQGAARWNDFLDIVTGEFAQRDGPLPVAPLGFPAGSGTPEVFTALIGDQHLGKFVDPKVVGSKFGYGAPIFLERFTRLSQRILRLFQLHSTTAPFSAFRIHFLGDGVDGVDMRRGHGHRVDIQSATQQMLLLVDSWDQFLRTLAQLPSPTGEPIQIDVVWDFGNHGRVGDFGVNLPADNWDYVAGEMLKIAVRDLPNVTIGTSSSKYHITQLGPMRVYSSHGDAVKGGDGFAGLPINGLARALAKDTGLHQQLFDLYLTAHFHTVQDIRTQTGRILMNGSWDGGDDYSINQLKVASEPLQVLFAVHPERGITWKTEAHLAPARRTASPVEEI